MVRGGICLLRRNTSIFTKILIVLIILSFVLIYSNKLIPVSPPSCHDPARCDDQLTDSLAHVSNDTLAETTNLISQSPMIVSTTKLMKTSSSRMFGLCEHKVGESLLAHRFPHIIIIGFGKAGTRATYQMIRMHPDVLGPSSEMRFFSNDAKYKQGINFYVKQMPLTSSSQKTIEKSPDYITKPEAAVRLQQTLVRCQRDKNIKFIVVLRDPFDRSISEYLLWKKTIFEMKKKQLPPFEEMCVKKNGEIDSLNKLVNASIYSYHLENWLKYYEMKQICFVDDTILVKNPYYELKKLEKCLELRSFLQPRHFYFNKKRGFFCPVKRDGKPKCLGKSKGVTHPKINIDVERKLREFFIPFNKRLYDITGVNYGWK